MRLQGNGANALQILICDTYWIQDQRKDNTEYLFSNIRHKSYWWRQIMVIDPGTVQLCRKWIQNVYYMEMCILECILAECYQNLNRLVSHL
jgi:hypothetical protein